MSITILAAAHEDGRRSYDRELAATFTSASASERWLRIPNPILNGDQPIECLKRREYDRVHAALEAFNTGVYV